MKIDKIHIPVTDLETGDIVTLDTDLVMDSGEDILSTPIRLPKTSKMILDATSIDYSNYIVSLVCENGIFETIPIHSTACFVVENWQTKTRVPIFVKDVELKDRIIASNSGQTALVLEITDNFSDSTRKITLGETNDTQISDTYSLSPATYLSSTSTYQKFTNVSKNYIYCQITARYTDLVFTDVSSLPTDVLCHLHKNYPPSIETQCFTKNMQLLLKSVSNADYQSPCSFVLGKPCSRGTTYRYHGKHICGACIKKIAAIAVYGGRDIISNFNEKMHRIQTGSILSF